MPNLFILPNKKDITSKVFTTFEPYEQTSALRNVLKDPIQGFDFLLIDTPPTLELHIYNAIVASHYILIPIEYRLSAIDGLGEIFKQTKKLNEQGFTKATILGIFVNNVDKRLALNDIIRSKIQENKEIAGKMLQSYIRTSADIAKAEALRLDVWEYRKRFGGEKKSLIGFKHLVTEILHKINNNHHHA